MQILDRRNRLFGKIHILLVGVPLLIILAIVAFISLFARPGQYIVVRVKGGPGNWWWVTPRPPEWYVSSVQVGDQEIDNLGRKIAEIQDVQVYESGGLNKDIYLRVRLRATYNPLSRKYKYKSQPVQVGAPITLELERSLFSGNIVWMGQDEELFAGEFVDKIVFARLYNAFAWEYDAIRIGEQMTDGTGTVIAEILDKSQTAAQSPTTLITEQNEMILGADPTRRDISITVKIRARKRGADLMFREEQLIKVGKTLWAFFPSYDVAGAKIISVADTVTP